MSAAEILADLRAVGIAPALSGDGIAVPAGRLTDTQRQAVRDHKPALLSLLRAEVTARDADPEVGNSQADASAPTQPGSGGGGPKAGTTSHALVATSQAVKDDQPNPERWTWPTGTTMTEPEIAAFQARVHRFTERGLARLEAETMAHRLAQRGRDGDDRRMCLECSYLGERGHCLAARTGRLIGAAHDLQPVPDLLQRCEGFGLRKGLA